MWYFALNFTVALIRIIWCEAHKWWMIWRAQITLMFDWLDPTMMAQLLWSPNCKTWSMHLRDEHNWKTYRRQSPTDDFWDSRVKFFVFRLAIVFFSVWRAYCKYIILPNNDIAVGSRASITKVQNACLKSLHVAYKDTQLTRRHGKMHSSLVDQEVR
jgi:hypothetical protein